eukprot:TRINITY_DN3470_c0_g1_i1.p1 TRINITY_DN3470_c0_g1~~TRINITY_DN3470_c0_g1_i1.p1  ORF type:complete len:465 (-),score=95.19 TRINITY_DN3470_c0_g1_i1:80-1414(-)
MVSEQYVMPATFRPDEFLADVKAAKAAVGEATLADARHLQFLMNLSRFLVYGGHLLVFLAVAKAQGFLLGMACLVGAFMISTSRCMSWTIIGHHVSHGGYDKYQKNNQGVLAPHLKRGIFAIGWRRFLDWMDWMLPQAWDAEHNKMHHYYLSEEKDPDLVERNFELLHKLPLPMVLKYASMIMWIFTWKLTYYSPSTFKEMKLSASTSWVYKNWPAQRLRSDPVTVFQFVQYPAEALIAGNLREVIFWPIFALQWAAVVLPMILMVVLPSAAPLLMDKLGCWQFATAPMQAARHSLLAMLLAEMLTNAHSFLIIACNHSGGDLYRYSTSCKAYSAEWFLRCAYSSSNFECGTDFIDIMYGWLNYQIEHHMFPDMTPLQYRKLQPLMKSLCEKHGVQYVQQNAFYRMWRMLQVAVGDDKMQSCTALVPPAKAVSPVSVDDKVLGG